MMDCAKCVVQCGWDLAFEEGAQGGGRRGSGQSVLLVQAAGELLPYPRAEGSCGCVLNGGPSDQIQVLAHGFPRLPDAFQVGRGMKRGAFRWNKDKTFSHIGSFTEQVISF